MLKQVPSLCVLAFIVNLFLGHMSQTSKKIEIFHKEAMVTIKENTLVQGKVLKALNDLEHERTH
jgi:hypothetical protein